MTPAALALDHEQQQTRAWLEDLRDRICRAFEAIEAEAGSAATFEYIPWFRDDDRSGGSGGGTRGAMRGRVFEKVGVNVSTVGGTLAPEFARTIHGAEADPRFLATGLSLVAHMANPHVPAVHMNLRLLETTRRWWGGGADLNPALPRAEDTAAFHAAMEHACAASPAGDYPRFKAWADEYFYVPHRRVHRGVGGIFYDHVEAPFADGFALTRAVGEAFLEVYPAIVRARRDEAWDEADRATLLRWRGRYAEFNLVHDRGTLFGLKTGGNIDAILMSLPPLAQWD